MNCDYCGQPLRFIPCGKGKKKVPVQAAAEYFTPTESGGVAFATTQGSVRTGTLQATG